MKYINNFVEYIVEKSMFKDFSNEDCEILTESAYQDFFRKKMKEKGITSFKGKDKAFKSKFFSEIKKEWAIKKKSIKENLNEKTLSTKWNKDKSEDKKEDSKKETLKKDNSKKWAQNADVEAGKMKKLLDIPEKDNVIDHYKDGKKLAKDLIKALKGDEAQAKKMLGFAANVDPKNNVLDVAYKSIETSEE
jgi:hypothetical protein